MKRGRSVRTKRRNAKLSARPKRKREPAKLKNADSVLPSKRPSRRRRGVRGKNARGRRSSLDRNVRLSNAQKRRSASAKRGRSGLRKSQKRRKNARRGRRRRRNAKRGNALRGKRPIKRRKRELPLRLLPPTLLLLRMPHASRLHNKPPRCKRRYSPPISRLSLPVVDRSPLAQSARCRTTSRKQYHLCQTRRCPRSSLAPLFPANQVCPSTSPVRHHLSHAR